MSTPLRTKLLASAAALSAAMVLAPTCVMAQSAPSDFTSATRYDALGRVTGSIAPDPDGAGSLKFLAVRNTYDSTGNLTKVEKGELASWQSEAIAPASWAGFTVQSTVETTYDIMGRKIATRVKGSDLQTVSLTQFSYTAASELECTAVRMNSATFAAPPTSACALGTAGSYGNDRITKNTYTPGNPGQLIKVQQAYGSPLQIDYATYTYSGNGERTSLTDARGMLATMAYDGFGRQVRWNFPDKVNANTASATDYEEYGYDANGNRTSLRKRDGSVLTFTYDNLNRNTAKIVPERAGLDAANTRDVYYGYDLRGLQTFVRFDSTSGEGPTNTYDGFGRLVTATAPVGTVNRTLNSAYDANSNRTWLMHDDGVNFQQTYDGLNRPQSLYYYKGGDPNSGAQLQTTTYNADGTRAADLRSSNNQDYTYDPAGRLNQKRLVQIPASGATETVRWNYTFNPASQLSSVARTNDAFAFTGNVNVSRSYTANGLNQYTVAGPASFCYDANGNLTADGSSVYLYDIENRLVAKRAQGIGNSNCAALSYGGTLQASLRYDPAGRLSQVQDGSGATTRFLYDGDALVAEFDGAGTLLRRYAHGPDAMADDPLFWFEGATTTFANQRQLVTNHQGSVVAATLNDGSTLAINRYDEYGIPQSTNAGRFGYTGQTWLPEVGMWYYKARIYSPTLGRFLQTDPIEYKDQVNLYAYVGNDPIDSVDSTGMDSSDCSGEHPDGNIIYVCSHRHVPDGLPEGTSITVGDAVRNVRAAPSPQRVLCNLGDLGAGMGDAMIDVGGHTSVWGAVGGATIGADAMGVTAIPGAMAGAAPGMSMMGLGDALSSFGNLSKDLSAGNIKEGAVRFMLNFAAGKIYSRVAKGSGLGAYMDKDTRDSLIDLYGMGGQALLGRAISSESPVDCRTR